jgi:hypothetical protein
MLESGRYSTIKELAAAETINESYVCRVLRLTLLAPEIVEAVLDGRQPEGMTLPGLMEAFPVEWEWQKERRQSASNQLNGDVRHSNPHEFRERDP